MDAADARRALCTILSEDDAFDWPAAGDARAWERLAVCARREGVGGFLLEAIERDHAAAPSDTASTLRADRESVRAANRSILRTLRRVSQLCATEGIDAMAMKGAALLLRLYDDPGLRPMCDLDLLIHPADADRFDRVVGRIGYRRGRPLVRKDFYPRYYYEAEYLGGTPGAVRLDVHVRPFRPMRYGRIVPEDGLWRNMRRVKSDGVSVCIPGDTEMLLHLACHAAFHGAGRLLWLMDICQLVTRYGVCVDWARLAACLDDWRLSRAAAMGFDRVEEALGGFLSETALASLVRGAGCWQDRLVLWQAPRDADSPWSHVLVDLLTTPGIRFRFGYLCAVAFPDSEHMGASCARRHRGWLLCAYLSRAMRKLSLRRSAIEAADGPLPNP